VRCSNEDLENFFPEETIETVYRKYIAPVCKIFIVTQGKDEVLLKTPLFEKKYPVEAILPVSTIGAGDNFNAGVIYGIMKNEISLEDLSRLSEKQWDGLIAEGQAFAKDACLSLENFVSKDFLRKK
jgi:fructokinase